MPEEKLRTRRHLLKTIARGLPAVAAGGALAQVGLAGRKAKSSGNFPGDPEDWRQKFLGEALAERGNAPAVDTIAPPIKISETPMVANVGDGFIPLTTVATRSDVASKKSAVVRMQEELKRALQKPVDQRKWIMVIDLRKCIGCSACTVACKSENHLPPGVVYRPVIDEEIGDYPNVSRRFLPRPCMQCDEPPCVDVCPVGATWKREDGIVVIDYNACIGCRYCLAACPYGARYFDFGDNYTDDTPKKQPYEDAAAFEYGKEWMRDSDGSPVGNARKCQFCIHRLNAGMLPACVTTCIGVATYFGDKNDPDSLVNELIASERVMRLKEELGTEPKVYYLL
jgi:molybdopterin-containing oxidoreductase family iron-sulfur binding subunit